LIRICGTGIGAQLGTPAQLVSSSHAQQRSTRRPSGSFSRARRWWL